MRGINDSGSALSILNRLPACRAGKSVISLWRRWINCGKLLNVREANVRPEVKGKVVGFNLLRVDEQV